MELGLQLRKARESLGISLEELEAHTRIQKQYLAAIEKGQYHLLPGAVYVRSYVRTYALAVGLDPRQALNQLQNVRMNRAHEDRSGRNRTVSAERASRMMKISEPPRGKDNRWHADEELDTTRSFGTTVRWDPKRVEQRMSQTEATIHPPTKRRQHTPRPIPVPNDLPPKEELGIGLAKSEESHSSQSLRDAGEGQSSLPKRSEMPLTRREAKLQSSRRGERGNSQEKAKEIHEGEFQKREKPKKKKSLYTIFLIVMAAILVILAGIVFYLRSSSTYTTFDGKSTILATTEDKTFISYKNEIFLLENECNDLYNTLV